MIIEGQFILDGPICQVWEHLIKPEVLATCVPGCEKMEAIDEKTYESIVGVKVGFISVKFKFRTTLTELTSPRRLKAIGKGEELNKFGNFSQETTVDLEELPEDKVKVSYTSNISISGKLATFGDRIMKAKAKQIEKEFTEALRKELAGKV